MTNTLLARIKQVWSAPGTKAGGVSSRAVSPTGLRRKMLRGLAVAGMLGIYALGTLGYALGTLGVSGLALTASTTTADAGGRGRGRGWRGRGGRGRGWRGRGYRGRGWRGRGYRGYGGWYGGRGYRGRGRGFGIYIR